MSTPIRIDPKELFDRSVDEALAREKAGRQRVLRDPPPVAAWRRLLHESLFHLPAAAILGALLSWLILEPHIHDLPMLGGELQMVNADPFVGPPGAIQMTISGRDVWVFPGQTELEAGADGQAAYDSLDEIQVGDPVEVAGLAEGGNMVAAVLRPASAEHAAALGDKIDSARAVWAMLLFFPLTASLIALGLLFAEGVTTRNWARMVERCFLGVLLTVVFSLLAIIPAGLCMALSNKILEGVAAESSQLVVTSEDVSGAYFMIFATCRSAAWAFVCAGLGLGMNIARSTRVQLRNSVIGGALGGAVGGLLFDPIDRFAAASMFDGAATSRLVGVLAVGLAVGIFVALVERLAREAWIRVRTGPLAGKSFVLYKTPTLLGSAPASDIYLFKDAEIDANHAQIHRVGNAYEIEDLASRSGTEVDGQRVRRGRLASGARIRIGSTVLEFEERQRRQEVAHG